MSTTGRGLQLQGSGKSAINRSAEQVGRHAQQRGPAGRLRSAHQHAGLGRRPTPTHFHKGHDTSLKQQFFQTFAFIFLEGMGRQEDCMPSDT